MYTRCTRGFTFVELLIVLAVIVLLSVISAAAFKNFYRSASLKVAEQETYQALVDARNDTLASKGDTVHGVHIEPTKIVSFEGTSYSSTSPTNVEYVFAGDVTATPSLTGGATEVTFERLTGIASVSGTITLSQGSSTKVVAVIAKWLIIQ